MSENNLKEINVKVNTDNIKAEMKKLVDAENKIVELEAEAQENQKYKQFWDDNTKGEGTISMTPDMKEKEMNGRINEKTYVDPLDLLFDVQKNNPEIYKIIKAKAAEGLSENKSAWEFTDKSFETHGKSILMRVIEEDNKRIRTKNGFRG